MSSQPPPSSNGHAVSAVHAAVLKRFDKVASTSYPFAEPEFVKITNKRHRVNLKSSANVWPLAKSLVLLLGKIALPPLTIFLVCLGVTFQIMAKPTGLAAPVCLSLAAICAIPVVLDPFFMHFVSNGALGNLGTAAGALPTPTPGIFGKDTPRNARIKAVLQKYVNYQPTPYFYSGDLLTLMPFLLFKGSKGGKVPYQRYWVRVPAAPAPDGEAGPQKNPSGNDDDDEAVALDVVFPPQGHQPNKPTFLVLHGLNGGSTEPYVLDLARRATREGHTVAVLINRGLMKTPVRGMDTFHGARTSDVACAVDALLYALGGERRSDAQLKTAIVLVGFSMGGIVAANYAAKAGKQSGLAGALSFSGTLCSEKMLLSSPSADVSRSVWQPLLAWGLKATIIKPNMVKFSQRGVTAAEVEKVVTVTDIDRQLVCKYHGYDTVEDYYRDMSAGGAGDEKGLERLKRTQVPLLACHAMDDPIAIFEVTLADQIAQTHNVVLLATKHGGHIGWPQGMSPSSKRWSFMMDIAMDFAQVVVSKDT